MSEPFTSGIENDTPEEWVAFDTIVCNNEQCHDTHLAKKDRYLFLGIGPYYNAFSGRASRNGEDVQLWLGIEGIYGPTWSYGSYMRTNYHIYNRETCG